ncbi:MAG: nitric oxide reductase activation protein NorD [Acidobacteriota bacterium]
MSEPEDLILEGAYVATRVAREAWKRYGPARRRAVVLLADERPRLELFLSALFMQPVGIASAQPPAPTTWLARLARRRTPGAVSRELFPGTDGSRIFLPPSLRVVRTEEHARELYRLLAVEQAVRLVRGSARAGLALNADSTEWFLVREAEIVDCWIASELPGLVPQLLEVRARALAERSNDPADHDHPLEQAVRAVLQSDLSAPRLPETPAAGLPRHRPVRPVWYWGQTMPPLSVPDTVREIHQQDGADTATGKPRVSEMRRSPRVRPTEENEDDRGSGTWMIRPDEPQESVEDPHGLQRPTDRDDHADPDGLGDSLSDLPEARVVRTPGQSREVLRSGDEFSKTSTHPTPAPKPNGIVYPEWDYRAGEYRHPGAIVRERPPLTGSAGDVRAALARHRGLVRRVRTRFERMQPRRVRLGRQPDGSEVDIDAFVTAAADLRSGVTVDGRLYLADRHARRELAVALLVDVSASTDAWVSSNRRIVDVEKDALLIVCEALDALGDRYAISAFSGHGPENVWVMPLKRFDERSRDAVQRRIAALDSERYTRLGAAIRHVTVPLCREQADRRLLLVLSDGKPNDEDVYEGQYGVEDTRQAVAEARRQGITVFCLTVDRAAPRYAARIFGRAGFAVLRRAEDLPLAVVDLLRQLVRA